MLILTRRVGETVVIGNDVTVTVLGVKGNQVRLGVNAPREVAVHREEIFERIKREQAEEKPRPHLNGRPLTRSGSIRLGSSLRTGAPACGRRDSVVPASRITIRVDHRSHHGEMAEWSKAHPC